MASKRQYLSQDELEQYADITIIDSTEAFDQISQAEEIIDAYVGFQCKAVCDVVQGKATSGTISTLTLDTIHQNVYQLDYFLYCICEIIGGTGVGQQSRIVGSTLAGVLTVDPWDTAPDSTSIYKIYQVGKFPRPQEEFYNGNETPPRYYRHIPEAVRRAVAAQVEYVVEMGTAYFKSNASKVQSESIGDYSYSNAQGGPDDLVAPKAKILLRGIRNKTGEILS